MPTLLQRVLVGVAVLIVGFLLVKSLNVGPSGTSTEAPPPALNATAQAIYYPTQIAALGQQIVPTPNPDAEWTPVVEVSGADSLRSSPFRLTSSVVRLRYKLDVSEGNSIAILAIFVVPDGQPADQSPGIPEVFAAGPGEGERLIGKDPGSYLLNVQVFGGSWTVTIDEQVV